MKHYSVSYKCAASGFGCLLLAAALLLEGTAMSVAEEHELKALPVDVSKQPTEMERLLASLLHTVSRLRQSGTVGALRTEFVELDAFHNPVNAEYIFAWKKCRMLRIAVRFKGVVESNWSGVVKDDWIIRQIGDPYVSPIASD